MQLKLKLYGNPSPYMVNLLETFQKKKQFLVQETFSSVKLTNQADTFVIGISFLLSTDFKVNSACQGRIVCRQTSLLNKLAQKPKCVSVLSAPMPDCPSSQVPGCPKCPSALNTQAPKCHLQVSECPNTPRVAWMLEFSLHRNMFYVCEKRQK